MTLIVDEVMLREPNLLIPGKKPVGMPKIDWSHPLSNKLKFYLWQRGPLLLNLVDNSIMYRLPDSVATVVTSVDTEGEYFYFSTATTATGAIGVANYSPLTSSDGSGTGDFCVLYSGSINTASQITRIIYQRRNVSPYIHWGINGNDATSGYLNFYLYNGGVDSNVTMAGAIDNNEHVYICQRKGSDLEIYKDGIIGATAGGSTKDFLTASQDFTIGHYLISGAGAYPNLGDQRFYAGWDRSLSSGEIKSMTADPYQFLIPA